MATNEALKPCPFCGSKELGMFTVSAEKRYFRVICKNSRLKTGWHHPHVEGPLAKTEEEAIAAWNKRVEVQV